MVDTIPESMAQLLPKNPKPTYKYVAEDAGELEGIATANRLLELFKERAIPENIFQVLRDIPDTFNEMGKLSFLILRCWLKVCSYFLPVRKL